MKFFIVILSVLFLVSCSNKTSKEILPPDKMKVVMIDLIEATEWNNILIIKDTALRNAHLNLQFSEAVFEKHHTTKEQFYNSYNYYLAKPDKMKALLDSAYAFTERKRTELTKAVK